jgi:hypothetical protein
MKSAIKITIFIVTTFLVSGCASQINYNDNNYEITCQGEGSDGVYLIKVYTYASNEAVALEQAKHRAIHGVMFKGLRGGNCGNKPPLCSVSYDSKKEFFDNFFLSKEYLSYTIISNDYSTLDRIKTQNGVKMGFVVTVDKNRLRKYLENNIGGAMDEIF